MDLDKFNVAVHRVRAGQFLREKTAAAVGLCAIDAALQARAEQVEDPDLFKIATQVCPEDALGFYMKLGGKVRKLIAGKPPPGGYPPPVSLEDEAEQAAWEAKHRPAGVSATAYAPPWTPEERAHHLGEDKGKSR